MAKLTKTVLCDLAQNALEHRQENLKFLLSSIASCDKAIAGLPKLVEANEGMLAGLERGTEGANADFGAALAELPESLHKHVELLRGFTKALGSIHRTHASCLVNLAKTQLGFARMLKTSLSLQLLHVAAKGHEDDCDYVVNMTDPSGPIDPDAADGPKEFKFQGGS